MAQGGLAVDPITLEVIRNRLDAIANEMEITLLKSSYSPIVKEGLDASAAIFDVEGNTLAQACAIPVHLGTLIPAVRRIIEVFPPAQMKPGDVYLMNDPYDGGTHLPDIIVVAPVVYQGQTIALGVTIAHHQEMGGKTPGSIPTDATEIYQEGLCIPPLQLYDEGKPNTTLLAMIERNVRIPEVVRGDLEAQVAACFTGRNRLLALVAEYGVDTVLTAARALLDHAERMTRQRIAEIPDGSYTFADYLDNDGIELDRRVKIQATVTVKGDELFIDFEGTDPQTRGPFNCVRASTWSSINYLVRAITDPAIPNNAGCFRPVHAHLPEGTVVNPRRPAPVNARTATIVRITDVLLGAMVQAMPDRIPAAGSGVLLLMSFGGIDPATGRSFVTSELGAGGMGARPGKDGVDAIEAGVTNCMNIPVEPFEMSSPLMVKAYHLRTDSGGAGKYRGGLGVEKIFAVRRGEVTISHRGERFYTVPYGLFGGLPGASCAGVVSGAGGERNIQSKEVLTLLPGEEIRCYTSGGAGWGDPRERPPALVLTDVLDGRVSAAAARDLYGVVLAAGGRSVDEEATAERRRQMAGKRQFPEWPYCREP